MTVYYLQASKGDAALVATYGDLDLIAYVARKLKITMDQAPDAAYTVHLDEVSAIGDPVAVRTLVNTADADADTANYLLTKRIRKERGAAAPAVAE